MEASGSKQLGGKKRKAAPAADGSGNGDADAPAAAPSKKVPTQTVQSAATAATFRAPDASEVLEIARTRNLYKSNLFRMQLQELLRELAPAKSYPKLEACLRTLQTTLQSLAARTIPETFAEEFPQLHFHQRHPFPFSFGPPKRIDLVGSYLLGTCMRSNVHVDVALEMPSEAFQSKDYLNFRYIDKRAAYMGEVYRQLGGASACGAKDGPLAGMEVHLEALQGDPFRPCVSICPSAKAREVQGSWVVRLLATHSPELWAPEKLAPERNAVRPGHDGAGGLPSTAHYNSCVLEDSRMRQHLELLHRLTQRMPALRDAILLLKRWALTRGFLPQASGAAPFTPLNGFCVSMLAAHAGQTASIAPAEASSFQLFKLALSVLASTDWANQKLVLGKVAPAALSDLERRACGAHFYDGDGGLNLFWRLGPFIGEIQREAKRALKTLDVEADPYDAVFGSFASPELLWDLVVRTPPLGVGALCPDLEDGVSVPAATQAVLGSLAPADAPEAIAVATRLSALLSAGLGDRCLRVATRLIGSPHLRWSKSQPRTCVAVCAGLTLEASNLDRAVDRGPAAKESAVSAHFRNLWGADKAELRRFKDGSILECTAWSKPPIERSVESAKRPSVVTQIVRHLVSRHLPKIAAEVDIVAGPTGIVPNLGDRARRLWLAFEAFRAHLCQLSSLPLTIKDVHPVDTGFSYSEVVPTAFAASDAIARTLHSVVVEFEASGRWPADPQAARKVAAALLLQMREELRRELGIEADAAEGFLDVRYPEFVFRLRVFHPRELLDAAHRVTNFQVQASAALPSDESLERLRMLWWQPRLRAALHGHVLQQPALAGTVRLCKRWMASQMLAGYDDFVEHLVASVFLQPLPFETPTSPQVGLCRVCWLLDTFDWEHEPLIVDFDGKLTDEERLTMRQSFESSHADVDTAASFWVASRFDPHALLLTRPPATVSMWLRRRAHQALSAYNKRLLGTASPAASSWQSLFELDTSIFDVLVRLVPQGSADASTGAKKAQRRSAASHEAVLGVVSKLRAHLSPACLVFHGAEHGIIAVKWRPSAFFPQHQNALTGAVPQTMVPQRSGQPLLCVPNVLCLTSTIASLAEGLAVDLVAVGART